MMTTFLAVAFCTTEVHITWGNFKLLYNGYADVVCYINSLGGQKMRFGQTHGATDLLFRNVDWFSVVEGQKRSFLAEISSLDGDRLLNTSTDALVAYFSEKFAIDDVPTLNLGGIVADQQETEIDVRYDPTRFISDPSRPCYVTGTAVEVEIPFSGNREVFFVQPTTYTMNPPRGEIRQDKLILRIQGTNLEPASVKQRIDSTIAEITMYLERLRQSAMEFNRSLPDMARSRIEERKKKLLADRNLVSGLGFALKQRDGAGQTYVAPEVRRKITPTLPPASTVPYSPEPILSDFDYENILTMMERMVRVMECSPKDFREIGEETLRSHFLIQLNGQYAGQATGETFNYEGKTDILIKSEGKNIFIAECKFWKGQKKYLETIDQLLGYLSWRDTKAAVVIFNRNKGFSNVLAEIEAATPGHPNCKRFVKKRSETSWIYSFAHRDDPNREMLITVMAFDVPGPLESRATMPGLG